MVHTGVSDAGAWAMARDAFSVLLRSGPSVDTEMQGHQPWQRTLLGANSPEGCTLLTMHACVASTLGLKQIKEFPGLTFISSGKMRGSVGWCEGLLALHGSALCCTAHDMPPLPAPV